MTFWNRDLIGASGRPAYEAIFEHVRGGIEGGDLAPGDKLPSQRWLSRRLGVSLGTVTRAYELARARHLVSGEVGRGTFVRARSVTGGSEIDYGRATAGLVDCFQNFPVAVPEEDEAWQRALGALASSGPSARGGDRAWSRPSSQARSRAVEWFAGSGLEVSAERVVTAPSLQVALSAVLDLVTSPGSGVGVARLGHPVVPVLAERLGRRVVPLAIGEHGLDLAAVEAAVCGEGVRCLVCEPTLQTPTAATMPTDARRRLAELLRKHDVVTIELDSASPLRPGDEPRLVELAPDRVVLIQGLWQTLSLGLRVALLVGPSRLSAELASSVATVGGLADPLAEAVFASWVATGDAGRIVEARRTAVATRYGLAVAVLGGDRFKGDAHGHYLWLCLPHGHRADGFVAAAERRGVAVTAASWFRGGPGALPEAVRVCLGPAEDLRVLEKALGVIAELLDAPAFRGPML